MTTDSIIPSRLLSRRALLGRVAGGMAAAVGTLALPGCDRLAGGLGDSPRLREALWVGESLSYRAHRLIMDPGALAPEFSRAERSPRFRTNGNTRPRAAGYRRHVNSAFADWRLRIDGRVHRPLSLSLPQLLRLPQRTQVTRHDCVEGWSAIAEWQGTRLGPVLAAAGLQPDARFVVFHCADDFAGTPYYESIDLVDAFHPQTILAHRINGAPLPIAHGAPLRLRVERQLGYKHAKYVMRIEVVASLRGIGGGQGGYWEDHSGYEWYGGI